MYSSKSGSGGSRDFKYGQPRSSQYGLGAVGPHDEQAGASDRQGLQLEGQTFGPSAGNSQGQGPGFSASGICHAACFSRYSWGPLGPFESGPGPLARRRVRSMIDSAQRGAAPLGYRRQPTSGSRPPGPLSAWQPLGPSRDSSNCNLQRIRWHCTGPPRST